MSDNMDQLIDDAFTEFDAAERAAYLATPGSTSVRSTVARRRRVRNTTLGLLAAAAVAVPVALLATAPRDNNSPPVISNSPTADATPTPIPTPSPTATSEPGPTTPAEVLNATLDLPAFPGLAEACGGAGRRTFVNGVADLGNEVRWTIGAMAPIETNLDGVTGNELLTTIKCDTQGSVHVSQLVALKFGGNAELSLLGYVINSPDTPNLLFLADDVRVEAGVVLVTTNGPWQSDGWPPCFHQVRGYSYASGAFKQVSGPTRFPAPESNLHDVDFRNTGVLVSIPDPDGQSGAVYCVPMVDGVGATKIYVNGDRTKPPVSHTFSIGAVSFLTDLFQRELAVTIVTYRSPQGVSTDSVQLFVLEDGKLVGEEVLHSGVGAVSGIDKVDVQGGELAVTLTTGSASQVWTYAQSEQSSVWQRKN